MRLLILTFLITVLFTSCADILYVEQSSTQNDISLATIKGFWFSCEFGFLDIDCMTLDDDGVQFTDDGNVFYVEEHTQMSEDECSLSPCFDYSIPTITVNRQLLGSYTYSDSSLIINFQSNSVLCAELITWNNDISFFREGASLCLPWESPYIKKYTGEVVIN